jgi:hypothetical protein
LELLILDMAVKWNLAIVLPAHKKSAADHAGVVDALLVGVF